MLDCQIFDSAYSVPYQYDASGNLSRKAIGGAEDTMTYDKANQLSSRRDATGVTYYGYEAQAVTFVK